MCEAVGSQAAPDVFREYSGIAELYILENREMVLDVKDE
jgi:hypothetical protein